ncbi:formylglycine-generating enzyme family protein [Motilimonas eburnea]|uniref:formylglycine-generating enzyme family protein n=1 Tax=Motilimonas eburnea TaxID=1737488 RepID=UPI001E5A130D|nr:SUMF1/EgtB/PvdO family nonheme iron enzyme [Motilimonas eburnea]MCE2571451.1 formylglycine-generating enzyme family protein [Motilimonas eburnea]
MEFIYQQNNKMVLEAAGRDAANTGSAQSLSIAEAKQCNQLVSEVLNNPSDCQALIDQQPFKLRLCILNQLAILLDPRIDPLKPKMARIQAGDYQLGLDLNDLDTEMQEMEKIGIGKSWIEKETPRFSCKLSAFAIGQYLVTNIEYLHFINDNPDAEIPSSWQNGSFPQSRSNHPVYSISKSTANQYCDWLSQKTGRRFSLPSEVQWEVATGNEQYQQFIWGDKFNKEFCNSLELGLITTTPVGCFKESRSCYGVYDLAGNVEEWTSSLYEPYPGGVFIEDGFSQADPKHPITRGGGFNGHFDLTRCTRRHSLGPITPLGFRLCESFD